jgi:hypothetical protein
MLFFSLFPTPKSLNAFAPNVLLTLIHRGTTKVYWENQRGGVINTKAPTTNTDGRENGDDGLSIFAYTYARTGAGEWAQECFPPMPVPSRGINLWSR